MNQTNHLALAVQAEQKNRAQGAKTQNWYVMEDTP